MMEDIGGVPVWYQSLVLDELRNRLTARGFHAIILDSLEEIRDFIEKTIPPGKTVGLGGSVTIREAGIDVLLKSRGNTVFDHWDPDKSAAEKNDIRKKELTADYFLTGINAVTKDGEMVNIDGVGNRVAAMIFGPGHVIAVIGYNKITGTLDEAIWRIKNVASPKNCKRLNLNTPCAKTGRCMDCNPAISVCRITSILSYKPMLTEFTVILTPLELGY
ncbi:MAG TPA: lactate utilization protein [Smithellaceae bacterium]|jgi:L-lactate utilization protein LutB|nr:lactate utilization protein [Smithellaceae bacterium]HQM45929.1 lactate utilization protein [Smithellaceae bacterium]